MSFNIFNKKDIPVHIKSSGFLISGRFGNHGTSPGATDKKELNPESGILVAPGLARNYFYS
jgi:hypothetical protein